MSIHPLELASFTVGSFVSLFSMVDPPMAAPVFVSLTQGMPHHEQKKLARRVAVFVFCILLVFFVAGSLILGFFGISIDALRIGGGLMIMSNAVGMLNQPKRLDADDEREAELRDDIAFSPMAMPLLSGPGSIASLLNMALDAKDWLHYAAILLVLILIAFSCYWTLRLSSRLVRAVGETTLKSFTRIMGFILLCVGVQYLVNGVTPIFTKIVAAGLGGQHP
jgi:multiple antibiotic resistance protein